MKPRNTSSALARAGETVRALAARRSRRVEGAQAIQRAAAILRIVAVAGVHGVSVKAVTEASGLHKATAHRILRALFDEGLLEHDPVSRNYRLGIEIFALGAAMGERFDIAHLAQPALERLARETEDTAYLAIRSAYDGLCLAMSEGSYPIKTLKLSVRDRWPLGVGAFSMPLLAFLPDAEVEEIIRHNAPILAGQDLYTPAKLLAQVKETRRRGYAVNQILSYPTMCGVGVPVLDHHERPIAALCVTAIVSRMTPARQASIAKRMQEESRAISEAWLSVRGLSSRTGTWRAIAPARRGTNVAPPARAEPPARRGSGAALDSSPATPRTF
jgi:DNA-binding IclR family transcriptional regulator